MSISSSMPLLDRIARCRSTNGTECAMMVPVDDLGTYGVLCKEVARIASGVAGKGLAVATDGQTAAEALELGSLCAKAEWAYVFGETPEGWAPAAAVTVGHHEGDVTNADRFLVVCSAAMNLLVAGHVVSDVERTARSFTGGLSGCGSCVQGALAELLGQAGLPIPHVIEPPGRLACDAAMAHLTQIMAVFAQHTASRQNDMAADKNDLFSVLDILKAISAKRRSHDVLYVFVEQIARIVPVERCSVVRVWGNENVGHVLASHDDERVNNLSIDLSKYPEMRQALNTLDKVIVNNACTNPLTADFAEALRTADIGSIMVIPIVLLDPNVGSLFLRATRSRGAFAIREISFCEIVAEAASNALERAHLFESIQRANERLEVLATTDGLTGVYNRRLFRERFVEEFERSRRYSLPLGFLIFDIDGFKEINDNHGHLQGDSVLREMAGIALKLGRKSDLVARYGGEEFAVIMPQTDLAGAVAHARRLRETLSNHAYKGMPAGRAVTVSVGVAVLDHETMLDCEALIRAADGALYEAKRAGKNQVAIGKP